MRNNVHRRGHAAPRTDLRKRCRIKNHLSIYSEMWFEPLSTNTISKGQLWLNHICLTTYRYRPGARRAGGDLSVSSAVRSARSQLTCRGGFATICYLPGLQTPERGVLVHHMGAVGQNFFTSDAMSRLRRRLP